MEEQEPVPTSGDQFSGASVFVLIVSDSRPVFVFTSERGLRSALTISVSVSVRRTVVVFHV